MKKIFIKVTVLSIFISLSFGAAFAQTSINTGPVNVTGSYNGAAAFCPYTFTKNLSLGKTDDDVKRLQQILNTDQRTIIAQSGIASPGNETNYYGASTRDTVKRFQALFVEYIGIANGVFGPKTRTVMNAVCNSEYFTSGQGNVYTGISTQNTANNNTGNAASTTSADTIAPSIYLRSNSTAIDKGLSVRIIVSASEPISNFSPESIIVEGATVGEIRKLSPNSYSVLITPNENAKVVLAQVEADRVADLAGNLNQNASNEIRISIVQPIAVATTTNTTSGVTSSDLDSIFNKIVSAVSPTPAPAATQPAAQQPVNQGYGGGNGGNNSGQNNQQGGLMNMLLLSSLMNRGNSGGGSSVGCNPLTSWMSHCKKEAQTQTPPPAPGPQTPDINTPKDPKKEPVPPGGGNPKELAAKGGKVKEVYECKYLATSRTDTNPGLSTPGKEFRAIDIIGANGTAVIVGYTKALETEDKFKASSNKCYLNAEISKVGGLLCCKDYKKINNKFVECILHDKLGEKKIDFNFTKSVDFSASGESCSSIGTQQSGQNPSPAGTPEQPASPKNPINDPNSLTPSSPSTINKAECIAKAKSIHGNNTSENAVVNAVTSVRSTYPECSSINAQGVPGYSGWSVGTI